jgi:predicted ATP-grasp superfamily ATP-dependent carboligase
MPAPAPRLRVLLSEGSSTSAREAITALGLAGHHLEICDPDPFCLGRFSRFVKRFHRCPPLGRDPEGYLAHVLDLVAGGRFDVLLPIHEQGYLFAKVQQKLLPHVGLAVPDFASYALALAKDSFSRLIAELDLAQPATTIMSGDAGLPALARYPVVVKAAVGTASRGVVLARDRAEVARAAAEFSRAGAPLLIQNFVEGTVEHAQAVFRRGELLAMHAYGQVARGAGGGDAIKESLDRPDLRAGLERIGERLAWHGALSVDVIRPADGNARYIDCNPRLVEPMSAALAGLDLAGLLVAVSRDAPVAPPPQGRAGLRSHLAIQALIGCAVAGASRRALLRECADLLLRRGAYAGSREELTPARLDRLSSLPAAATAVMLLARPAAAARLPQRFGAHLLTPESMRRIALMV